MEIIRDNVMVEWENTGEGYDGEYNPDDPDDVNFLRFYVSKKGDGEWVEVDDASYCTLVPDDTPEEVKRSLLEFLMDEVYEEVSCGHAIKKLCERLSWIEPSWADKIKRR